jgi:hypothetical protein
MDRGVGLVGAAQGACGDGGVCDCSVLAIAWVCDWLGGGEERRGCVLEPRSPGFLAHCTPRARVGDGDSLFSGKEGASKSYEPGPEEE